MSRKNKFAKGRFNLHYLTKEGFRNVRVHKLMTVASVTVMLSCLLLIGGAYLIFVNIQSVIDRVGEQNVIMVFIEDEANEEQEETLRQNIVAIENVNECTFVSRDESYSSILYSMGDTSTVLQDIDSSFLPNAYKVTIDDMELFDETVDAISELDNVLTVRENGELAGKLASIQNAVFVISIAIVAILLIVSLFIIANTVRITMYSRSLEISIMKAVGATNWFIRWPFLVEGITIGIISAIVSYGLVFLLYYGAERIFAELFDILGNTMVPFEDGAVIMIVAFLAIGIVTGALGSLISLGRYLKEHGKVVANENE
ncbi:MAG: permease-like cell division protein FtsX [Clostridiales bacterium]|nr:permease-like cell division protein FtsX [Clostridiales bacterium]